MIRLPPRKALPRGVAVSGADLKALVRDFVEGNQSAAANEPELSIVDIVAAVKQSCPLDIRELVGRNILVLSSFPLPGMRPFAAL